jgi:hypothetical protein
VPFISPAAAMQLRGAVDEQGPIEPSFQIAPGQVAPPLPSLTVDAAAVSAIDVGPPVRNAPYSAEATTEIIQTFLDGNRIVRRSIALVYRDSRGRIRREMTLADIAGVTVTGATARTITISDPDSGTTYMVGPDRGQSLMQKAPGRESGPTLATSGAPPPARLQTPTPQFPVKEQPLGTRTMEGVHVEGTRRVVTIPAGAIGNERAFDSITERWFSPELQIAIMSRQLDPRFGETRYQLTKISRVEPAAELFETGTIRRQHAPTPK